LKNLGRKENETADDITPLETVERFMSETAEDTM
jgi:hypothetical protein